LLTLTEESGINTNWHLPYVLYKVIVQNYAPLGPGFETKTPITAIFINASNAFTGTGSSFSLSADYIPCVPEPETWALTFAGMALVSAMRHRRKAVSAFGVSGQ
jgi:hypothetical protein